MPEQELKALWFKAEFVWGFSSHIAGYNKTSPSFLFPPPTTVIGALLGSASKRLRSSERAYSSLFKNVAERVYSVALRPVNFVPNPVADMVRSIKLDEKKDIKLKFDVPAKGRVFYISRDSRAPTIEFIVLHDAQQLSVEDALKVNRIGSRESLVSVVEAEESEKVSKVDGVTKTRYSFPETEGISVKNGASCYREYYAPFWGYNRSIEEILFNYYLGSKDAYVKYCVPKSGSEVYLSAAGRFAVYRLEINGEEVDVVGLNN